MCIIKTKEVTRPLDLPFGTWWENRQLLPYMPGVTSGRRDLAIGNWE